MIITITGKPGSGKSTVGKLLAQKLNYQYISIGDLRGEVAKKHNITIDELNKIGETQDWTDKEADEQTTLISSQEKNLVIDGRVAFHFAENSFNIYIDCDWNISAKRIFENQREDEQKQLNVQGVKNMIIQRHEHDKMRYEKWYNIEIDNLDSYDLVIDSTNSNAEKMVEEIIKKISNDK